MACARGVLWNGTCSLLLAACFGCDPDPVPKAPTLGPPTAVATGGDTTTTTGPDGGDGLPDTGGAPDDAGPPPDTGEDDATAAMTLGSSSSESGSTGARGTGDGDSTGGPTGDCCEANRTPSCAAAACAAAVCGDDPYCCDTQWDAACASIASGTEACDCGGSGPGDLVINEVLYDHPGTDVDVFIEIAGAPGASLRGVSLEAINGNDGVVYATHALSGTIAANGIYLIVDPAANRTLQAAADDVDSIADLQNGPDSLRLLVDGAIVDALGYGLFGSGSVFAGEGNPAEDIATDNSLSRISDTDDNAADFVEATPTPGAPN